MGELIDKFEMKTNFEGLIKLLAKNLYSDPNVFIRELVQNAHDSIVRRQITNPEFAGTIDIITEKTQNKLIFLDNGIGMNEQEIKDFLSVIGSTGTGASKEEHLANGLDLNVIGQFGIGMLSAFVVADKVMVRTKRLGADKAFSWINHGSMECFLYSDDKINTGTEIHVYINPDYQFVLNEDYIQEAVKKYCDFIPFPISINNSGTSNIINAPWHKKNYKTEKDKYLDYELFLRRRYRDLILEIIPIEINDIYKCKGVLYISDAILPDITSSGIVDIFVRRMFVRSDDKETLPVWAKFVQGIIDSPDLKPTAARDNIQRNEAAYEFIRNKIGEIIVNHLINLAEKNPSKFKKINKLHHYHLKGMAAAHNSFFDKVANYLIFDTNKGQLSLKEIIEKTQPETQLDNKKPIYYFSSNFSAPQFFSLADGKNRIVINAGAIFEEPLLEKYAYFNQNKIVLQQLDSHDDPNLFARITDQEQEYFRLLELEFESILRNYGFDNIIVRTRKFEPETLPAILLTTAESEAEQKLHRLMNEIELLGFDEIAIEAYNTGKKKPVYLSINANNNIINSLAKTDSYKKMNKHFRESIVKAIYSSTLLYSQDLQQVQTIDTIHLQMINLINLIVNELNK